MDSQPSDPHAIPLPVDLTKHASDKKSNPADHATADPSLADAQLATKPLTQQLAATPAPVPPPATATVRKDPANHRAGEKQGAQSSPDVHQVVQAAVVSTPIIVPSPPVQAPAATTNLQNRVVGTGGVVSQRQAAAEAGMQSAAAQGASAPSPSDADASTSTSNSSPSVAVDVNAAVDDSSGKSNPDKVHLDTDPAASAVFSLPARPNAVLPQGKVATAAPQVSQTGFTEVNQPKIISSIAGELMPHGGTMQIRLDPPELGALQVTVHMRDGVMTASFETSSDHATKLLSHSLGQLKSGLEAAGMTVEKLHVEQAPKRDTDADARSDSKQAPQEQQQQANQEKQRREMVQRMWQKLSGGDPLDMVA